MKRGTMILGELHAIVTTTEESKPYIPGPTPTNINLTGPEIRCIARVLNSDYPDNTLGMTRGQWWKEGKKDGVEDLQYFGHKLIALGILDSDA